MDIIKKINQSKSIWQILPKLDVADLENAIQTAAEAYYNTGKSLITDEEYDLLVEKLKQLKPNSKALKLTGAPVRGKKVQLPYWMGSMDKIKTDEKQINKWISKYGGPYVISDKLDGISCLLDQSNGKIRLYTRGDGYYGQDVSHLLEYINIQTDNLPMDDLAIRGELIMTKKNFKKYEKVMSNARNMVAGIVNSKRESLNKDYARDVDFVSYETIVPNLKSSAQLVKLKNWGLAVVSYELTDEISLQILDQILIERKHKSKYEIDGLIVTDDHKHERNTSGNPTYSFAYKGMTETADVKVIEVLWRPSKDGVLVPRIHFEKVRLSQADLEYATGFNAKFIVDNGIGPGAIITVIRSGDVIPYVLGVVKKSKISGLPLNCDYEWDDNEVSIRLRDSSENRTVIITRLTKFVRDIGVENLSEGIMTRLVDAGFDTIEKIVSLTVDDLLSVEGFKETLANKLYNNLSDSLDNLNILTLMVASNVFGRGFGERKLKKILDSYPNIVEEYNNKNDKQWREKIMNLEGFDTITVNYFFDSLPDFQKFYKSISKIIDIKPYKKAVKKGGSFTGQNLVFTGFRNKTLQDRIEKEGGKVSSGVSRNTTLLVYKDGEESSAKYLKAKELGIKTISLSDFIEEYDLD